MGEEDGDMKIGKVFVVVAASLVAPGAPVIDGAAAAQGTTCLLKIDSVIFDPGIGNEPTPNNFYSLVDGTIECDGAVHGRQPTGPGVWVGNSGHLEGTCVNGGKGTFAHSYRIPTKGGEHRFGIAGTFTFGALKGGLMGGEFDGDEGSGTFSAMLKKGDCVTAPVTEVSVPEVKMTLKH